jgi:hypothetical protein
LIETNGSERRTRLIQAGPVINRAAQNRTGSIDRRSAARKLTANGGIAIKKIAYANRPNAIVVVDVLSLARSPFSGN